MASRLRDVRMVLYSDQQPSAAVAAFARDLDELEESSVKARFVSDADGEYLLAELEHIAFNAYYDGDLPRASTIGRACVIGAQELGLRDHLYAGHVVETVARVGRFGKGLPATLARALELLSIARDPATHAERAYAELVWYASMTFALADAADRARAILAEALDRIHSTEVRAFLKFEAASLCQSDGDNAAAILHAFDALSFAASSALPFSAYAVYLPMLESIARASCERDDDRATVGLLMRVVEVFGKNESTLRTLAGALVRLGRHAEATPLLDALVIGENATTDDAIALSLALDSSGLSTHAIEVLSNWSVAHPESSAVRLLRASLEQAAGNIDAARADVDFVIERDGGPDAMQARVLRAEMLLARNEIAEALDDMRIVVEFADLDLAADALRTLFMPARMVGYENSIAAILDCFLCRAPANAFARARRAQLRLAVDDPNAAFGDVRVLVHADPPTAVALATDVLKSTPQNAAWLTLRGVALMALSFPRHAETDFDEAIRAEINLNDISDNLMRRASCLVMATGEGTLAVPLDESGQVRPGPWEEPTWLAEENAWCLTLHEDRIDEALDSLYLAYCIDDASARGVESMRRYLWVLDRALGDRTFSSRWLELPAEVGTCLLEARRIRTRAFEHFEAGQWDKGILAFRDCQAILEEAGLPLEAARQSWMLAISLGSHGEVQRTLDLAEDFIARAAVLDSDMISQEGVASTRYRVICRMATNSGIALARLAKVNALSSIGAHDRALAEISDLPTFERDIIAASEPSFVFEAIRSLSRALHHAGRPAAALELLDRHPSSPGTSAEVTADDVSAVGVPNNIQDEPSPGARADAARRTPWQQFSEAILETRQSDGSKSDAMMILNRLDRIARLEPSASVVLRVHYWRNRGRALCYLGRFTDASISISKALDLVDNIRLSFLSFEIRAGWLRETADLFELAAALELAIGNPTAVFDLIERARARVLMDELALDRAAPIEYDRAEELAAARERLAASQSLLLALQHGSDRVEPLHRFASSVGRTLSEPPSPMDLTREIAELTIKLEELERRAVEDRNAANIGLFGAPLGTREVAASLPPGTVLVEYARLVNVIVALALRAGQDDPDIIHVKPSSDVVETHLARSDAGLYDDPGDGVLQALIAPILACSAPGETIVIVPWTALQDVAFHACPMPDGMPLIARNPIVYAPSASIMVRCRERRALRERAGAIVFGDPLRNLFYSACEAEFVGGFLRTHSHLGPRASIPTLTEALRRSSGAPSIVHLACHAVFENDDPMNSSLLLAPIRAGRDHDDGILQARQLSRLPLDVDLVTLSACSTGVTARTSTSELFGLARAALVGGAAAMVLSSNDIEDLSTSLFFFLFYSLLTHEEGARDVAEALQRAQLMLRQLRADELLDAAFENASHSTMPSQRAYWWSSYALAAAEANDPMKFARGQFEVAALQSQLDTDSYLALHRTLTSLQRKLVPDAAVDYGRRL